MSDIPFKAFIRVVKSLTVKSEGYPYDYDTFGSQNIIREPLIYAQDKAAVKKYLSEKYPQFFPEAKVFEKETKDKAQFFYVVIYPLYEYEIEQVKAGEWVCDGCGQKHENQYISKPRIYNCFSSKHKFCRSDDDNEVCLELFKKNHLNVSGTDLIDDARYVRADSPIYIYKITEKSTGKCYIGQTRNDPIFRWWDHLKRSTSPFGVYLRETKRSNWTFEILEELPWNLSNKAILKCESEYILKFNSIDNGFNTVISNNSVRGTMDLFDEQVQPIETNS